MGTYVVGDIHGCLDEWLELKNKIESQDLQARFILVGDIIDRGPKTYETILWAMKNITPNGKYQLIRGNHEDMKIDWWRNRDYHVDDYGFEEVINKAGLNYQQVDEIISFFKSLPLYKEFDINLTKGKGIHKRHYIIVHAGLRYGCLTKAETIRKDALKPYNTNSGFVRREAFKNKQEMLWSRNIGTNLLKKSIVVHGHTPTFDMDIMEAGAVPGQIHFINNNINVDCGVVYRSMLDEIGNLGAIRLEDLEEFYLYPLSNLNDENYEYNQQQKVKMLQRRKTNKRIKDDEWNDFIALLD